MSTSIDPRVSRTKELFENALLDLMEEKEYNKITVQEIAKRSTLNRATFYLHYYDKEELLQTCLDDALKALEESVKIPEVEFKYESHEPHPVFIRMFEQMMRHGRFYKIMLAENKIPSFSNQVIKIIDRFVRSGSEYLTKDGIEKSVPHEIALAYISSAYLGVIIWWLKNDMPYTPTYMSTQLTVMSTIGPFAKNPFA